MNSLSLYGTLASTLFFAVYASNATMHAGGARDQLAELLAPAWSSPGACASAHNESMTLAPIVPFSSTLSSLLIATNEMKSCPVNESPTKRIV